MAKIEKPRKMERTESGQLILVQCPRCGMLHTPDEWECERCGWEFGFSTHSPDEPDLTLEKG